jgi:hypothetical protein
MSIFGTLFGMRSDLVKANPEHELRKAAREKEKEVKVRERNRRLEGEPDRKDDTKPAERRR